MSQSRPAAVPGASVRVGPACRHVTRLLGFVALVILISLLFAASASAYYNYQAIPAPQSNTGIDERCTVPCTVRWDGFAVSNEEATAEANEWQWSIPGAAPSSATTRDVSVVYSTWGTHSATMTARWTGSGTTVSASNTVAVDPYSALAGPKSGAAPRTLEVVSQASNLTSAFWWTYDGGAHQMPFTGRTGPDSSGLYHHFFRLEGTPIGRITFSFYVSHGGQSYKDFKPSFEVTSVPGPLYSKFRTSFKYNSYKARKTSPRKCYGKAAVSYAALDKSTVRNRVVLQRRARRGSRRERRWRKVLSRTSRNAFPPAQSSPNTSSVNFPLSLKLQRALGQDGIAWRTITTHEIRDAKGRRVWRKLKTRKVSPQGALNHCRKALKEA